METVSVMITGKILEFGIEKVCEKVLSGIGSKLNNSDLEKALKISVKTACEKEERLFYSCQTDGLKGTAKFLNKFFTERAIEELQKPLKNEGNLDIDFLTKAFIQESQTHSEMEKINKSCVKSWMKIFVDTYFKNTNTYIKLQVTKECYFKQLANWFDDIKFAGIAVPGQEIEKSEELAQIFVMPDVEEDVKRKDYRVIVNEATWNVRTASHERDIAISEISYGKRQQELLLEQRQRALINRSGNQFLAANLLTQSDSKKFVLLGAPGSGKTTLLSYFAVMVAQNQFEKLGLNPDGDYLPILIKMRDLSRFGEISILDYAKQFAENDLLVKNLPEGFFEYWLEEGRALILLDGLDEIAEESKRYRVVRRIENFIGNFQHNITIITSRPAGYKRDFFRTEEFPHYELLPFDDEKVEEFINRWYDSRFQDKAEAERRKESLRKALNDKERIKLLARNPLLLTIIALIHRYQAVLPKERHKLYDKAVETLITSWDANKELTTHQKLQYLELDDLRRLMEILAYWIHTQGNTGDKEGGTLIDCDELLDKLKREIKLLKGIELYKAEEEAKRFIDLIKERTGLLNEQGYNCYAFVHKTFQEYLCAEKINYQADDERDFEIIVDHIRDHLHDQHWREVLLLLVAQQKPKQAAKAIRVILNRGSEYEQWLHRDLFFAADCLAEDVKGLNVADEKLGEEILRGLVDLEMRGKGQIGGIVWNLLYPTLCNFHETAFEKQTLQLLKTEANQIDKVRFGEYREIFGEEEQAKAIFIELLNDSDSYLRYGAVKALGIFNEPWDIKINVLIDLLNHKDWVLCYQATNQLRQWNKFNYEIIHAFLNQIDIDSFSSHQYINALSKIVQINDFIISELLKKLDEKNHLTIQNITDILGDCSNQNDLYKKIFFDFVKNENTLIQESAKNAIENFIYDSETLVNTLLKLIDNENFWIRRNVAYLLGILSQKYDSIINKLLELSSNNKWWMREGSVYALSNCNKATEAILDRLLELLNDNSLNVSIQAIEALGKLGKASSIIIAKLNEKLDKQYHDFLRCNAANALVNLGIKSDVVIQTLQELLYSKDSWLRFNAAEGFVNLDKDSKDIVDTFVKLLNDKDYNVGISAAYTLVELGKDSDTVINALVIALADNNSDMRRSAAIALRSLGKDSHTIINALIKLLVDEDREVRKSAALALGNLGKKSNKVSLLIEQWLQENQDAENVGDVIDALWNTVAAE
ncbi:MAG: HEAT repeat domain-containing protein [Cyanobacteria bacterium P01_D01_bin.116]